MSGKLKGMGVYVVKNTNTVKAAALKIISIPCCQSGKECKIEFTCTKKKMLH
jgi:hypothetical protein